MKIKNIEVYETPYSALRAWIEYSGNKKELLQNETIQELKNKSIRKGVDKEEFELISFEFDKENESFLRNLEASYYAMGREF